MIIAFYPNPNKPVYPVTRHANHFQSPYNGFEYAQAAAKKITVVEWRRRDKIVREEAAKCPFVKGSIVFPTSLAKYEQYGSCTVTGISSVYNDFADNEEWPSSDLPYIIHAIGKDKGTIQATANFFSTEFPKE